MIRRRGAFSLLELLVAVSLSLLLIAAVAGLFGRFVSLQEGVNDRLDGRRQIDALCRRLEGDTGRAVAIAELSRCFDHAPTEARRGVRADQLELVVLDDAGELERVRWSVAWDPVTDRGYLWRETFPVTAAELPIGLSRLAGGKAHRELVSSSIARFRLDIDGREDVPTTIADLTIEATGAKLLHDELTEQTGVLAVLGAGDWVWLKDDRIDKAGLREGYYRVRTVEGDLLTFRKRIGNSSNVMLRAAKLPQQTSLDLIMGGTHQTLQLPLGLQNPEREGIYVEPKVVGP